MQTVFLSEIHSKCRDQTRFRMAVCAGAQDARRGMAQVRLELSDPRVSLKSDYAETFNEARDYSTRTS